MKSTDKLFELLRDSGAAMLTVIPRDAAGKSCGVVVVVSEALSEEFQEFLEQWSPAQKPAAVENDDYGWDT